MRANNDIQRLFQAIESDDADLVYQLLDSGVDPNSKDSQGRVALAAASDRGNGEIVEALLVEQMSMPHPTCLKLVPGDRLFWYRRCQEVSAWGK